MSDRNSVYRKIVVANYLRKPFRSFGLSLLIAVLSFVLLCGTLFSLSLETGLSRVSARLGADLVVFPQGTTVDDNSLLLQADTKYRYMPREVVDFVRDLEGVEIATHQFFLTTLGSSCCDQKVNVIGFDPASDFVIQPWIREVYQGEIPKQSVIVGSDIVVPEKKSIKIFDREYAVIASLDPIGNRLDQAIFAEESTLADIRRAAEAKGIQFLTEKSGGEISSVLVKLKKDADLDRISRELHSRFDDLQVRTRKDMFSGIASTVSLFKVLSWILAVFFFLVAEVSILIAFSISAKERKREFAVLRVVGVSGNRLKKVVLAESLLTSVIGVVVGVLFGSLVFYPFQTLLGDLVGVPFLLPGISKVSIAYLNAVIVPLVSAPLAAYEVANKVSESNIYESLKEK